MVGMLIFRKAIIMNYSKKIILISGICLMASSYAKGMISINIGAPESSTTNSYQVSIWNNSVEEIKVNRISIKNKNNICFLKGKFSLAANSGASLGELNFGKCFKLDAPYTLIGVVENESAISMNPHQNLLKIININEDIEFVKDNKLHHTLFSPNLIFVKQIAK